MTRAARAFLVVTASIGVTAAASACGTQKISVSRSQPNLYHGAVLFNQRCGGCHTLSYAATHGSAAKVTTAQFNNGPNFNVRCERPVARVLYAIENGGFSGAIMPQNVVVGQDAIDVANFVAKYAGRQAPIVPGSTVCVNEPIGTLPPPSTGFAASSVAAGAVSKARTGATGPSGPVGTAQTNGSKKASSAAKANHAKGQKKS